MSFVYSRVIANGALVRIAFLGVLGLAVILFPNFLKGGIIYVLAVYAILQGILGIAGSVVRKDSNEASLSYFNVITAVLTIVSGILCLVYFRYIISVEPLFFGVLLVIEGTVNFVTVLRSKSKLKTLSILISVLLVLGGFVLMIFSFGFGGLSMLSKMFGVLLLLSCTNELLIYLIKKKTDGGSI